MYRIASLDDGHTAKIHVERVVGRARTGFAYLVDVGREAAMAMASAHGPRK